MTQQTNRLKDKRALLILVAVALLGLALWWQLGSNTGAKHSADSAAAAPGSASAQARNRLEHPRDQGVLDVRSQPRGSIAGTVTHDKGGPVPGARVCGWVSAEGLSSADTREPLCTDTDANGAYRLKDLVPGSYSVIANAPRFAPAYHATDDEQNRLRLAQGQDMTGVDLVLESGAVQVHGVVKDIGGGPIADAWVGARLEGRWRAGYGLARSDAEGAFTLWMHPGIVDVSAEADGYAEGSVTAVAPGQFVEVFLTPESVLAGRVVEAGSDKPVARAFVEVHGDWADGNQTSGNAYTDDAGLFRITRLAPGRYKPTAEATGLHGQAAESVLLGLGATRDDVIIEVHPAFVLTGSLLVDGDEPTPCPRGYVSLHEKSKNVRKWGGVDPHGVVEFKALLPGTYTVEVECNGYLSEDEYPDVVIADEDVLGLQWLVKNGARIVGTVTSSTGEPVAWANVSARSTGGDPRGQKSWGYEQTRRDGSYEIKGLVGGGYNVSVDAADQPEPTEPVKVEVADGATETVDIALDAGATVEGTVVDERGAPVAGASVRIVLEARWGGWRDNARTADDGTFVLTGVRPGAMRVVASRSGSWWGGESLRKPGATDDDIPGERITVRAGETARVKLVVESQSGTIRGRVVDETGKPVSDAFVDKERESDAAGAEAGGARRDMRWAWSRKPILTDVDGRFELDELSPGKYTVRAFRRGGGEAVAEHVEVGGDVVLTIASTGSMAGTVSLAEGGAPSQFHVTVSDRKQGFNRSEYFFKTRGAWILRDLPAGDFTVSVGAGEGTAKQELSLAEGQDRTGVALVLESRATVTGTLVAQDTGAPVAGFRVFVHPIKGGGGMYSFGGDDDKQHITDSSGAFKVERAPAGRVYVSASPEDWEQSEYSFARAIKTVPGGEVTDVGKIEVLRRRVKGRERAGDLGYTLVDNPPDVEPEAIVLEVALVRPDGPAANSGLKTGDIIVSVDELGVVGEDVFRYWGLTNVTEGTTIRLGVKRGETLEITAGKPL